MTNQNNEFGKSPVKLSSPTQIWIDDVNQNNELDEILAKAMAHYKAEDWNGRRILTEAKQAIQALYAPKPVENGELRDKAHKTLDVYLDGGGPYEFVIVNKDDYERTIEARLAERAKLKEVV